MTYPSIISTHLNTTIYYAKCDFICLFIISLTLYVELLTIISLTYIRNQLHCNIIIFIY